MTKQDIDLQKIQVLESSYQGWFNFKASLIAGVIIGLLILLATTQLEKIFPPYAIVVGDFIVIIFGLISIRDMKQSQENHIDFISDLLQKIEKGEKLDSIEIIRKTHGNSPKNKDKKSKASEAKSLKST